jgi:hypothetical protein
VAAAVEVARVDQVDSSIKGGVDGGEAFGAVSIAVQVGHAHSTEANA